MQNRKVTFETAKLAKEKGFNVWCQECWDSGKILPTNDYSKDHIFAPTQSLLQKWLRVEHNIDVLVEQYMYKGGNYFAHVISEEKEFDVEPSYIYEQTLEQGLQEALKLINND